MDSWHVGDIYQITRRWHLSSLTGTVEVSTGTASFRVHCVDQTLESRVYVQSNGTLGPTPHDFSLGYSAGVGWTGIFEPGLSVRGLEITIEAQHSTHPVILPESHYVTSVDSDDIFEAITGAPTPMSLSFGP